MVEPLLHLAVHDLVVRFQRAFDDHNWADLERCLAPEIYVDYSSLRNEPPHFESAAAYCAARRAALDQLDLQHSCSNLSVRERGRGSWDVACNFQILRFSRETPERHFHSWGTYAFVVQGEPEDLVLSSIAQKILRSEGHPTLHAPRPSPS